MAMVDSEPPWYKQFWPWFIAFPPAATVVAGIITAWLAGTGPALVVDDYGQIGKVTTQRAIRDERARDLELTARVVLAAGSPGEEGEVAVVLASADPRVELPATLMLRIVHPTLEDLDTEVLLSGSQGRYTGRTIRPPGRLYLHLGDRERTWRLVGEIRSRENELELMATGPDD